MADTDKGGAAESRVAQGFGPTVTGQDTLARVAALLHLSPMTEEDEADV